MLKAIKLSIIIFLINFNFAKSEIVKPNTEIKPDQVIKIQLERIHQ